MLRMTFSGVKIFTIAALAVGIVYLTVGLLKFGNNSDHKA